VEPSLAGPKRPQDRVALSQMKAAFAQALRAPLKDRGFALTEAEVGRTVEAKLDTAPATLRHGAVVIAAITSCTNTSNPSVMGAAGLIAQKAAARGLKVPPWVKTSLAPGSRVVTEYLNRAGLTPALDQLGFQTVGYGCTTCIGNSGPLPEPVRAAIARARRWSRPCERQRKFEVGSARRCARTTWRRRRSCRVCAGGHSGYRPAE
jgi:aconitate hydratase